MNVDAVMIGKIEPMTFRGKTFQTGIFKRPVLGPVRLTLSGLEGDRQGDPRFHGGQDKALYAFASEAYSVWKELRTQDEFPPGAMGENLLVSGLEEDKICLGDIFSVGEALIQVTEPRFPCGTLAAKFKDLNIIKQFDRVLRPGIYFRVLKEGLIEAGQSLSLQQSEPQRVAITEMYELKKRRPSAERLSQILSVEALPVEWRDKLKRQS